MAAAGGAMAGMMIARNITLLEEGITAASGSWRALEGQGLSLGWDPAVAGVDPNKRPPRLDGRVSGATCSVRITTDGVYCATTEISALLGAPSEAEISVYPNRGGLLGRIRQWLGQDVEVGDPAFDEPFLVLSRPREAAAKILDRQSRDEIAALAAAGLSGLLVGDGKVVVSIAGVQADAEIVRMALQLAARVADSL